MAYPLFFDSFYINCEEGEQEILQLDEVEFWLNHSQQFELHFNQINVNIFMLQNPG